MLLDKVEPSVQQNLARFLSQLQAEMMPGSKLLKILKVGLWRVDQTLNILQLQVGMEITLAGILSVVIEPVGQVMLMKRSLDPLGFIRVGTKIDQGPPVVDLTLG